MGPWHLIGISWPPLTTIAARMHDDRAFVSLDMRRMGARTCEAAVSCETAVRNLVGMLSVVALAATLSACAAGRAPFTVGLPVPGLPDYVTGEGNLPAPVSRPGPGCDGAARRRRRDRHAAARFESVRTA
jgi:hypothetical protein